MDQGEPQYEQLLLQDQQFGVFNGGYCIKNSKNDCILYTSTKGSIYIPGVYASALAGAYAFDKDSGKTTFTIKDQSDMPIVTITIKVKPTE